MRTYPSQQAYRRRHRADGRCKHCPRKAVARRLTCRKCGGSTGLRRYRWTEMEKTVALLCRYHGATYASIATILDRTPRSIERFILHRLEQQRKTHG